jgi:hypothetical protein
MNAKDQYRILKRVEHDLTFLVAHANQLPGADPLIKKLLDARRLAEAWRCDQEAELPAQEGAEGTEKTENDSLLSPLPPVQSG